MTDDELIQFHERCKAAVDALPESRRRELRAKRMMKESHRKQYTVDELLDYFNRPIERKKAA